MAKRYAYRWRGFGEQARKHPRTRAEAERRKRTKPNPASKPLPSGMTAKQARYLGVLCERAGERFDSSLNKRQASLEIDRLRLRLEGTWPARDHTAAWATADEMAVIEGAMAKRA